MSNARDSIVYSKTSTATDASIVYVPESPTHQQEDHYWGPGQVIPTTYLTPCDPGPSPQTGKEDSDLKSLLQGLQSSVETSFQKIKTKLCDLEEGVAKVEGKQVELQTSPSSN